MRPAPAGLAENTGPAIRPVPIIPIKPRTSATVQIANARVVAAVLAWHPGARVPPTVRVIWKRFGLTLGTWSPKCGF